MCQVWLQFQLISVMWVFVPFNRHVGSGGGMDDYEDGRTLALSSAAAAAVAADYDDMMQMKMSTATTKMITEIKFMDK